MGLILAALAVPVTLAARRRVGLTGKQLNHDHPLRGDRPDWQFQTSVLSSP